MSDLSPLKALTLKILGFTATQVSDLTPLKGMPLEEVYFTFKAKRDAEILRSIKTLEKINGRPVQEFWKEVDNPMRDKKS